MDAWESWGMGAWSIGQRGVGIYGDLGSMGSGCNGAWGLGMRMAGHGDSGHVGFCGVWAPVSTGVGAPIVMVSKRKLRYSFEGRVSELSR